MKKRVKIILIVLLLIVGCLLVYPAIEIQTKDRLIAFRYSDVITMEYIEGNYCDTQFVLEENYITDFLERAKIEDNEKNQDILPTSNCIKTFWQDRSYTG